MQKKRLSQSNFRQSLFVAVGRPRLAEDAQELYQGRLFEVVEKLTDKYEYFR